MTTQLDESLLSQLDEPSHEQGWIIHSDPVAEREPKPKKLKVDPGRDASKDAIKWLCSSDGKLIPFVKRADSGTVHCGDCQMRVTKEGVVSTVRCLSNNDCHDPICQCPCFCHLLQAYYAEKAVMS